MTFGAHDMNTQDREEIERHFAMRFAADPHQKYVDYETTIEDAPEGMWETPTRYLWFDVVGEGEFSKTLFKTLQSGVYRKDDLPLVDGVTVATKNRFSGRIIGIGFSFDA